MAKPIHITSPAPRKPRAASSRKPTFEQIQVRAFEIFMGRGATPGDETQDWLQAERELAAPRRKPAAKSPKTAKAEKPAKPVKPVRPAKEQAA